MATRLWVEGTYRICCTPIPGRPFGTRGEIAYNDRVTPENLPFPMPIDVVVDGKKLMVPMPGGKGSVNYTGAEPIIDPKGWVLKQ